MYLYLILELTFKCIYFIPDFRINQSPETPKITQFYFSLVLKVFILYLILELTNLLIPKITQFLCLFSFEVK
jgi:hypothetical protein